MYPRGLLGGGGRHVARALRGTAPHRQDALADLHAIQPLARKHRHTGVNILAEPIALCVARDDVFDQVEGSEGPEGLEQLAHLLLTQRDGDAPNVYLIRPIGHIGAYYTHAAHIQYRQGSGGGR